MFDSLQIFAPPDPTVLPVSVSDVRLQVKQDQQIDDALLERAIRAAARKCESYIRRALITQTIDVWYSVVRPGDFQGRGGLSALGEWPISMEWAASAGEIVIPRGDPTRSVTSLTTYDSAGTGTVVSSSAYSLVGNRLILNSWSPSSIRARSGIKVRAVVGYGDDAASIPEDILVGIIELVAHMYMYREGQPPATRFVAEAEITSSGIPPGVKLKWQDYRMQML